MDEIRELENFPLVRMDDGSLSYGGSQKWFRTKWRRGAGCASVAAANLSAWNDMGVHPGESGRRLYGAEEYLELQNRMFEYMKPGVMGFPDPDEFVRKFMEYAETEKRAFRPEKLRGWKDDGEPFGFVRDTVGGNDPAILLVLTHEAPELEENTWHWMTITGYAGDGGILISNYGRREILDGRALFAPGGKNDVTLLRFRSLGEGDSSCRH